MVERRLPPTHLPHRLLPATSEVPDAGRITYIGHATLLIEMAGVRILTDPNFDSRLAPFLPRVSAPGIALDRLPELDALLLTHAHADHLSFESLNALPSDIPLIAPPSVSRWLNGRGYGQAVPLAPGESMTVGGVSITAAAARHMGARYEIDRWRSAANMYLLDAAELTCFFAGDTGLTPDSHRVVEERLGADKRSLDMALLPIGHAPWWKPGFRHGHLTPVDALELWERLGSRYFIPYHWGTFRHVTSGPYAAIRQLRVQLDSHPRRGDVKILEPGERFELTQRPATGTGKA